MKSLSRVPLLATTLSDCSLPGSSVHEIFQARVLEWVAISFFNHSVGQKRKYLLLCFFFFFFFFCVCVYVRDIILHGTWMVFSSRVCFKKWLIMSLSRIFFFFKLELLLYNLLWKRVLSGALIAGKICRLCKRVRGKKKKHKKPNSKELLSGWLLHNNGNSARCFHVWIKGSFFPKRTVDEYNSWSLVCKWFVSVSQLGSLPKFPVPKSV